MRFVARAQQVQVMSNPRIIIERLLAEADIAIDGPRPWDIKVHDGRFFSRVLTGGSLALGESYMDGWSDCPALDEMCARGNRRPARPAVCAKFWQSPRLAWVTLVQPANAVARLQGGPDLAAAQRRKLETICQKLRLRPGMQLLDIGCGWGGLFVCQGSRPIFRASRSIHGCGVTFFPTPSCHRSAAWPARPKVCSLSREWKTMGRITIALFCLGRRTCGVPGHVSRSGLMSVSSGCGVSIC